MAALVILVAIALTGALVAVVTSVLGIPVTFRRQPQRPMEPAPSAPAHAWARLLVAVVALSVTVAVLVTLALRWIGSFLQRLTS
jgi:hypothetical protein